VHTGTNLSVAPWEPLSVPTFDRNPADLGISECARLLACGELNSRALVDACLQRIGGEGKMLNAFIHVDGDMARAEADLSDLRRAECSPLSPLDGVPIALKDNIDVIGLPTTNGLGTSWMPSQDAGVVTLLRERGIVLIGKTNMHEGALGATTDNPHHGRTENPAVPGHTPGGSSGGSGAAVAARLCPGALGTDTMGSVRVPAAYCGIVGFKPSRGYWPISGVAPLVTELDTVGPMTRTVEDTAMLIDLPIERIDLEEIVLATLENFDGADVEPNAWNIYQEALARLRFAGATIRPMKLSDFDPSAARRVGFMVSEVEAMVAHESMMEACSDAFSPEFRSMLDFGARLPAARYVKAKRSLARVGRVFSEILDEADAIISLTGPQMAFPFDDEVPVTQADFTAPANFAGCPSVSLPILVAESARPVGLQVMAGIGRDADLVGIAAAIEKILDT